MNCYSNKNGRVVDVVLIPHTLSDFETTDTWLASRFDHFTLRHLLGKRLHGSASRYIGRNENKNTSPCTELKTPSSDTVQPELLSRQRGMQCKRRLSVQ